MSIRRWLVCVMFAAACSKDPPTPRTEVLLQIEADDPIRARAERLSVSISSGAADAAALTETDPELFDVSDTAFRWPASLALVAAPGHEEHVFDVTISVNTGDDTPLARSRVRSGFLKGKTLVLTTQLFGACIDMFGCGDDETCVADSGHATCVSADVDQSRLPQFEPGRDAGGGVQPAADGGEAGSAGNPSPEMDAAMRDAGGMTTDAGAADAGGPPSDAGASDAGGCHAKGPEDCWNGVDDDCNGKIDCADPACTPTAVCAPASDVTGAVVNAADSCPDGFKKSETPIFQGLNDPGCAGCSCSAAPTQCTGHVYYYMTTTACTADALQPYSGGTLLTTALTQLDMCTSGPIGESQSMETPVAWRATLTASPASCTANGTAAPQTPTWSTSMKLCTASNTGAGCNPGMTCVPRMGAAKICGAKSADNACPSGSSEETWQRGFDDHRSCSGCSCSAAGGDCDNVWVKLGHDWSCGTIDGMLHDGQKSCGISTYSPPAIMSGTPTDPTCTSSAAESGSVTASGALDLCCSGGSDGVSLDTP